MTKLIDCIINYKKNKPTTTTITTDEIFSSGQLIEIFDDNDILLFKGMVYSKEYSGNIIEYTVLGWDKELNKKVSADYTDAGGGGAAGAYTSEEIIEDILDTNGNYLYHDSSIDVEASFTLEWANLEFHNKTIREILDTICNAEDAYWWVEPDGKVWAANIADLLPNKVYYHATENFKSETLGTEDTDIDFIDACDGDDSVVINDDDWGADRRFKKTLEITGANKYFTHNIDDNETYQDITWEFFVKNDDCTHECVMALRDASDSVVCRIKIDADKFYGYYSAAWNELCAAADSTWYRVRIDVNTDNTFDVWIDGTQEVDGQALEDNDAVDNFHVTTDAANSHTVAFAAFGCPEIDNAYSVGDNEKGVCYEGAEICSVPQITEILQEINRVKIYGSIKTGTRIYGVANDEESQLLHGTNEYIDHCPAEEDQTELDALAAAILARTGFTDYPKYISVSISDLDRVEWGKTIRFHFTPFTDFQTAAEYYIIEDRYDVLKNIHHFILSNGLVIQEENLGQSEGTKVMTADEEQLDILGNVAGGGLTEIVEDLSPELGGDLSLNGHNIDFPTTANISDCLDEDDMASDSATALATQQSIKAYVDAAGGGEDNALDSSPDSDHTVSGLEGQFTAGEGLVFGDFCYMKSDSKMWKADADAHTTMPVVAMCSDESIDAEATGDFLLLGFARDDTWNWTITGGMNNIIYASTTTGGGTNTQPTGEGDEVQPIGWAVTADIMYFNPQLWILRNVIS